MWRPGAAQGGQTVAVILVTRKWNGLWNGKALQIILKQILLQWWAGRSVWVHGLRLTFTLHHRAELLNACATMAGNEDCWVHDTVASTVPKFWHQRVTTNMASKTLAFSFVFVESHFLGLLNNLVWQIQLLEFWLPRSQIKWFDYCLSFGYLGFPPQIKIIYGPHLSENLNHIQNVLPLVDVLSCRQSRASRSPFVILHLSSMIFLLYG